jgi:hypothetical protein
MMSNYPPGVTESDDWFSAAGDEDEDEPGPVKCGARNGSYSCQHIMHRGISGVMATHHAGMHWMRYLSAGEPRTAYWVEPYGPVTYTRP